MSVKEPNWERLLVLGLCEEIPKQKFEIWVWGTETSFVRVQGAELIFSHAGGINGYIILNMRKSIILWNLTYANIIELVWDICKIFYVGKQTSWNHVTAESSSGQQMNTVRGVQIMKAISGCTIEKGKHILTVRTPKRRKLQYLIFCWIDSVKWESWFLKRASLEITSHS